MKETLNYYRELLFSLEKEYNNLSPSDVRSHSHLPDKIEMVKQFIDEAEKHLKEAQKIMKALNYTRGFVTNENALKRINEVLGIK